MNNAEIGAAVGKVAPPATITATSLFGVPLPDLVLWATLIYTVLMAVHLGWKFATGIIDRRKARQRTPPTVQAKK